MANNKKIAILIVLVAFIAVGLWFWQRYLPGTKDEFQVSGTIEATSVALNAKQAGTIINLSIDSGDLVQEGQVVAELGRNDLVAQRERDFLSVLKAEATLADLQSGARQEEIREMQARVNIVQANLERAMEDLERKEYLFKGGAITQVDYEKAQTDKEILINELRAAEARLSLLEAGTRPTQINTAQVEVDRNKAILKATESMLEDLKIISPIEGVISSKNYELGEYVAPGASIATVVNLKDLWIKVYIPTDDLPQIALGQKVSFSVSGFSKTFTGIVEEIATKGEFTPKTIQTKKERTNIVFAVKIAIGNEDGILKPGMPADVVFSGGSQDD